MTIEELQTKVEELQKIVDQLRVKRSFQWDYSNQSVKQRHMGEPNLYVNAGLAADRPTAGDAVTSGVSIYFSTDTGVLSCWNGTACGSETLT